MITAVNYRPHKISPMKNPIVWGFISDKITEIDFSYVIDIYISFDGGTSTKVRLKQKQNPTGNGMVDVSDIVQSYIDLSLYSAETGWQDQYRNSKEIVAWIYIKVGEEYRQDAGNTLTIFDGIQNITSGEPDYYIGPSENTNDIVKVIPASLPYYTHLDNMANGASFSYWSDYFMDGDGKFLKRDDNNIDIMIGDRHTLTFLNWWENAGTWNWNPNSRLSVSTIQVSSYNVLGATLSSVNYNNTVSNGGGPQTTTTYTSVTDSQRSSILTFKCGTKDLGITSTSGVDYYTVTAYYRRYSTLVAASNIVASETVRFNVVDNCSPYPRVRFSWLNDLGGRDYWNFNMLYEKSTTTTQDTYSQTNLNWSGSTPVVMSGSTTANYLRGGDKIFNKNITTEFVAQTDWLVQSEIDFLGGIADSPSVWCYIGDDDIPYTVVVTDTSYTYKNIKQNKLVQATYKCRLTKIQNRQNI